MKFDAKAYKFYTLSDYYTFKFFIKSRVGRKQEVGPVAARGGERLSVAHSDPECCADAMGEIIRDLSARMQVVDLSLIHI